MPIVAETLPGYESALTYGIFAPAKTPAGIITRLNQEVARALCRLEVKEKFLNLGSETVGNSPEQFAATIASDLARFGKMIKDTGIRN